MARPPQLCDVRRKGRFLARTRHYEPAASNTPWTQDRDEVWQLRLEYDRDDAETIIEIAEERLTSDSLTAQPLRGGNHSSVCVTIDQARWLYQKLSLFFITQGETLPPLSPHESEDARQHHTDLTLFVERVAKSPCKGKVASAEGGTAVPCKCLSCRAKTLLEGDSGEATESQEAR